MKLTGYDMSKFRIEIQLVLLALVIATAVVTTGYFAYLSLSRIVFSIQHEAEPDNRLYLIKDIVNDLAFVENKVRVYLLTDNPDDLLQYDTLLLLLSARLDEVNKLPLKRSSDINLNDSIKALAGEKLELWQGILRLHQSAKGIKPTLTTVYSKLEKRKTDTIKIETEKKGFLRKVFGNKKIMIDTIYREHVYGRDELNQEIRLMEAEILNKSRDIKLVESQLIERNIILDKKLNELIANAEKQRFADFTERTKEVGRLAALTYRQLAAFTIIAVVLLMIALLVLFNYLRKARAYERALRETQQKAETLAKAKEQFVANVSHELRTPVNAICGLTELALQKATEPEIKELVSVISKSSRYLKSIINDTLDFSKIEANKIELESVDFSPVDICTEVLAIQQHAAAQKGISLSVRWEGEIPDALKGDPLRLKQILVNLISNAVKFTEQGSVTLNMKAAKNGESRIELIMCVEDTGIGISKDTIRFIFDEFVQAGNPSQNKQRGTGLGLFIVKKLVELQGGRIEVTSEPGSGTQVTVNLNFILGDIRKIEAAEEEILQVPDSFRQLSVLIADDDEFNTYLINNILKKWGVKYVEVSNGKEAVKAALNRVFDIILMDLHMPEMNGIEAAKAILGATPDARIVAVSATSSLPEQMAAKNAGMYRFISKPFIERDLFEMLIALVPSGTTAEDQRGSLVDTAALISLANGDSQYLESMVRLFIRLTGSAVVRMEEALEREETDSIAEEAHKMVASCVQIGAANLAVLIRQLEERVKQDDGAGLVRPAFQLVKEEAARVISFLQLHLDETGSASAPVSSSTI
jgi:signal transduction histidine kinase/CheY-like chemotaxis protein/HPt (histidine-containing phosphotransfer) domain-containing protein